MRYIYDVQHIRDSNQYELKKILNKLGQDGWKVVGMSGHSDGNGECQGWSVILMKEQEEIGSKL